MGIKVFVRLIFFTFCTDLLRRHVPHKAVPQCAKFAKCSDLPRLDKGPFSAPTVPRHVMNGATDVLASAGNGLQHNQTSCSFVVVPAKSFRLASTLTDTLSKFSGPTFDSLYI